jgi:hypothetical protein
MGFSETTIIPKISRLQLEHVTYMFCTVMANVTWTTADATVLSHKALAESGDGDQWPGQSRS